MVLCDGHCPINKIERQQRYDLDSQGLLYAVNIFDNIDNLVKC